MKHAGPRSHQRFLQHSIDYVTAVGKEAEYREQGEILDLASYETLRRENSAVRLCFSLCELCLGIDLPDEIFEDDDFMALYWAACDMVCWSNVGSISLRSQLGRIAYLPSCAGRVLVSHGTDQRTWRQ